MLMGFFPTGAESTTLAALGDELVPGGGSRDGADWQAIDATLDLGRLAAADHGLAVAVTIRPDGSAQTSVVNAGVLLHPLRDEPVVAFVARGSTATLRNLRERPRISMVFRAGWEWSAVEGDARQG